MKKTLMLIITIIFIVTSFAGCGSEEVRSKSEDVVYGTTYENADYNANDTGIISDDSVSEAYGSGNVDSNLPKPVELELVASNFKNVSGDDTAYVYDDISLHMVTDESGWNYLVLNYSFTNLLTDRKITNEGSEFAEQNGRDLERCYDYSFIEELYDNVILDSDIYEVRPGEKVYYTAVYEVYDLETDVLIEIREIKIVADSAQPEGVLRQFSFK